ncbi:hybrid sensor histidine kinase/response regulator [Acidovorax sp. SUPP2539]|uniref:ATP-binding response regulator n=1 Tax=Acidovorax sp. SUPP2539 TaxID=2920878 RepID=UPI0023DE2FFD|nr:hybrid sensor histidine kinase/response regulator [Acidovorax sp. SUPP2539]GKS92139.1 hybrid sensor histidine kinase/response regulator [Acidovorax sp. SUPP2539]
MPDRSGGAVTPASASVPAFPDVLGPLASRAGGIEGADGQALDLAVRRRLLQSLASRGSSEIAAVVIPGVLVGFYSRFAPPGPLIAWWVLFGVVALGLLRLRRGLQRDAALPDAVAVPKWERIFQWLSLGTGLMWTLPVFLTMSAAPLEFRLFLYMVLCAVIASATTFLAPVPVIFWRYFSASYLPPTLAIYWYFPQRWHYLLPLMLLYGAVLCRHAWGSRRFVVQQVEMERQRAQLAEQYRAAKEAAERALEEKNRFIATASHDLRQPLHAMGLLLETALQRNGDVRLNAVLQDVQSCVRSLNFMFNALLDLSRIEAGTFTVREETVSLRALFDDVATVFAPDAELRGLHLRLRLPRQREAAVRGDPALLRQMVFNLAQNALRYTASGGVLLGARGRGGRWRIEVWDTGAGVAPKDRHRIYAPFYRSDQAQVQQAEGHGLGLSVVARSAGLIGAGHGFESTPGRGSCFWLELPAAQPDGPLPAEPLLQPAAPWAERMASLQGRCLLVEDDPQIATSLSQLLQSWGLQVQWAATGAQAMARVDGGFVPDAVLCDHRLGAGESGLAVLQALLARCGHAHGAMVSGEHDAPALVQAEDDGYLVFRKPLAPQALHAVLSRWLARTDPV